MMTPLRITGLCLIIACFSFSLSPDAKAEAAASVVQITAKTTNANHVGSGFVWSKATWVVTALHVVAGADKIVVYSEKTQKAVQQH